MIMDLINYTKEFSIGTLLNAASIGMETKSLYNDLSPSKFKVSYVNSNGNQVDMSISAKSPLDAIQKIKLKYGGSNHHAVRLK